MHGPILTHADTPLDARLAPLLAHASIQTRTYQIRMIVKALSMFAGEHCNRFGQLEPAAQSVLIESPTGSGKIVMGLLIAKTLQDRHNLTVGWVMRRNLLAQAAAENVRRQIGLRMELISMFDKDPPQVDLLVVDEASTTPP